MSTFGNGTSQQQSGPTTILQKSHGHASASRGRLAARTCVSFARAASDSLMSYRVSCFSDSILDLHIMSVISEWVKWGSHSKSPSCSALFAKRSSCSKISSWEDQNGDKVDHMQEQSKNLVPARSRLLEHSVWIKLTMWKPESMKCKSGCGLGTTMQAKECVTKSHSSDPHSLLQLKRKRICKLGVSTIMYLLRTSSKELEEPYHQPCWKSM